MEREKSASYLGLGLLAAGIVILMFVLVTVFGLAANPGPWMQRQLPANTQVVGPTAGFSWSANALNVSFQDRSVQGSANITSYSWEFGDGQNSTGQNPNHQYANGGNYQASLMVSDENGKRSSADTSVNVQNSGAGNGQTNPGQGGLDLGSALLPLAIALLTIGLYIVSFLVGGSLVKAGWNLIRPRPETIRLRLKPQNWEAGATAEVVPPPMSMAAPPAMAPPSAEPANPPPPPNA